MTRDEVMAMTDEELRIKAAELLGWTMCFYNDIGAGGIPPGLESTSAIPDYPNNIAVAWELIERGVDYAVYFPGARGKDDIWARMVLVDRECGERSGDCPGDLSAPRAITRAFILAMEPS